MFRVDTAKEADVSTNKPEEDPIAQEQLIQDGLEEHDVEPEDAERVARTTVEDAEAAARDADGESG